MQEEPGCYTIAQRCSWFDHESLTWQDSGCSLIAFAYVDDAVETFCSCNHLTSFAVLMNNHGLVASRAEAKLLGVITMGMVFAAATG